MAPDRSVVPLRLSEPWDPSRGLLPAQATYCFRRALELDPAEVVTLLTLGQAYRARGMADAERSVAVRLQALLQAPATQRFAKVAVSL
jgi:hypothetical protein